MKKKLGFLRRKSQGGGAWREGGEGNSTGTGRAWVQQKIYRAVKPNFVLLPFKGFIHEAQVRERS